MAEKTKVISEAKKQARERSIVFDEAENRLTAMRGILVWLLYRSEPEKDPASARESENELNAYLKELFGAREA